MSEPLIPDPAAQPTDSVASSPSERPVDPLLGSDSFIESDRVEPESASPKHQEQKQELEQVPNLGFDPSTAIAAQPISMIRPGEDQVSVEKTPRRKNMAEMSVRPSWLPEDWKMRLKVRASGKSAGFIDRYYTDPTGQHNFRSKNEVFYFLGRGSKNKRWSTSEIAAEPSENPTEQKSSSKKRGRRATAADSDATRPQNASNGMNSDASR